MHVTEIQNSELKAETNTVEKSAKGGILRGLFMVFCAYKEDANLKLHGTTENEQPVSK